MFKIVRTEALTDAIYLMDVEAPRVAKNCLPGQFVIVRGSEDGERIPLTICDYSREAGTITIVFQVVGAATEMMNNGQLNTLNIQYACVVATALPIMCIYPFLQKYFAQGVQVGAVKG